jgi:hypothetical protein
MKNSIPIYRTDTIVATVTGIHRPSANDKTGDMLQMSILVRKYSPMDSLRKGKDSIVCGDCIHSSKANGGEGDCYVRVEQMPTAVWQSVKGHLIPNVSPMSIAIGKPIRLGAYGDPGFLPLSVLNAWTVGRKYTGYTHQWRTLPIGYATYLMASCETAADVRLAHKKGWRTFRTVETAKAPTATNEILCPFVSTDGKVQCADCRLCSGTSSKAKSIVIPLHGGRYNLRKAS